MILRGASAITLFCLSCITQVFAEQADLKTNITATSLKKNTAPITVMSNSILVKEQLKKNKSSKSVKTKNVKQVMTSSKSVNVATSKKIRKKATEPEIIQLEIPEQMLKVVNTSKSFVFQDITRRDKEAGGSVADLAKKQQTIESLRQASVRR